MPRYRADLDWTLGATPPADFLKGRYGRGHGVTFGSGVQVPGTASAHVVGNRWAQDGAVDPEEMLTASAAACHMLSFLHVAREAGYAVARYRDAAEGLMETDAGGRTAVTRITLKPQIEWSGEAPAPEVLTELHHRAHETCFIANSLKTEVVVAG